MALWLSNGYFERDAYDTETITHVMACARGTRTAVGPGTGERKTPHAL